MENKIELIDWSGWLFRCHALSHITATGRGTEITAKQKEELATLLAKIKLTVKQAERRDVLTAKLNAKPELSKGAKTYLEDLWVQETYKRPKDINSKYMSKGLDVESESLHLANGVLGWDYSFKEIEEMEERKMRLQNEYLTGEPDVHQIPASKHGPHLADIKSSWDVHTFPLFKGDIDPSYYAQGQGYMYITGIDEYELVYCLVDTPEQYILDEIRRQEWASGFIEIPQEHEDEIRRAMTFDDIPKEARVKRYRFKRDDEYIKKIETCVLMSREYLCELNEKFINNQNHE